MSCSCRFRRRNSSLENLNEMFLNDETSDKPKEDRIVKFKDEVIPERGRSRSKKPTSEKSSGSKAVGASILKDSSKSKQNIEANNKPELKPVIKPVVKKPKIPVVGPLNNFSSPDVPADIENKQTAETHAHTHAGEAQQTITNSVSPPSSVDETTDKEKDKEESGYDSDQTLATLSAKDSASEASSLNSPASLVKNKQTNNNGSEPKTSLTNLKKDCDSDVEQDLSLDSIVTQNHSIQAPSPSERSTTATVTTSEINFRQSTTQPPPSLLVTSHIDKIEAQFCSLDPTLLENVTSVEVDWLKSETIVQVTSTENEHNVENPEPEDEELKALCDEERSSVASSIPMDFGDSLPPTLTNLMHKQFSLYR